MREFDFFSFENITFTSFTLLDEKKLLEILDWRNCETVRKEMFNSSLISNKEHMAFVEKLKNDINNFYWLVALNGDLDLGVFYLNNINFINCSAELGIYTVPDGKIKGSGSVIMINALMIYSLMNINKIYLQVFSDNKKAVKFYLKHGFQVLNEFRGERDVLEMFLAV